MGAKWQKNWDSWKSKRIRTAVGKAVQARTNASSPSPPPTQVHTWTSDLDKEDGSTSEWKCQLDPSIIAQSKCHWWQGTNSTVPGTGSIHAHFMRSTLCPKVTGTVPAKISEEIIHTWVSCTVSPLGKRHTWDLSTFKHQHFQRCNRERNKERAERLRSKKDSGHPWSFSSDSYLHLGLMKKLIW